MSSIVREQSHTRNFTVLDNRIFNDERLTFEEIGVLSYILSKPANWVVRINQLRSKDNIGRTSMQRIMKNLEACGYAKLVKTKDANGMFSGSYWSICELPIEDQKAEVSDSPEIGQSEIGTVRKSVSLISKDKLQNKENIQNKEREQHSKKAKKQTESVHAVSGKSVDSTVERNALPERQFIQTIDLSSLEEKKEERQTPMPAALPDNSDVSTDASPDFSQFKKYDTCEAMTADLKAYYRSNPNEWKVGVLQASKGARFTTEQLIDLMTAWATWMEESNKLYNSPRKMDLAFRRWVLNQQQPTATTQAKPQQAAGANTAQAKAKNFQFI